MRNKKQINLGIIFVICLGLLITIFLSLKLGTKEINIRDFLAAFGMMILLNQLYIKEYLELFLQF
ncbi:hypothetical protein AZJ53_11535 [Streptococcus pneumoniae]|nr:hypothetical protein AZJ53_11535 [Streptococcus pneumoniae]